jgi:hypothetical protein
MKRILKWPTLGFTTEWITLISLTALVFFKPIQQAKPLGFAGLFVFMADLLGKNHFIPPETVPLYGPGGIPYAYPFLGFYLLAGARAIGISTEFYLRFVPPLFTIFSFIIFYCIIRVFSNNRFVAIVGTLLAASSPVVYLYHATSSGVVRAIALFLSLLTILAFFCGLKQHMKWWDLLLAGIFLGLTIMIHLTYAVFAVLSLVVIAVYRFKGNILQIIRTLTKVAIVAVIISSPWWLMVISRYGTGILLRLWQTHRSLILEDIILNPVGFFKSIYGLFNFENPYLVGAGILSAAIMVSNNRAFLPIWWFIVAIGVGESQRFSAFFAAWLTAELFNMFIEAKNLTSNAKFRLALGLSILIGIGFLPLLQTIHRQQSVLTDELLSTATWFQQHTSSDSGFLDLNTDDKTGEWLPYLTQRESVSAPWGSEWTDKVLTQPALYYKEVGNCISMQSLSCIESIIRAHRLNVNYILIPSAQTTLIESLTKDSNYMVVFNNGQFKIFYRQGK